MPLSSKLRAEYVELINQALDTIPMLKPTDFGTAVRDLEKILASTSGGGTLDFAPQLKESMETVHEFYIQPGLYVEVRANDAEYQQIIKDRIQAKINEFNSFTPAQKHQYVIDQKVVRDQAVQHQQTMAAGESRRAAHAQHMETEQDILGRMQRNFQQERDVPLARGPDNDLVSLNNRLTAEPRDTTARLNRARILNNMSRRDEALSDYNILLEMAPAVITARFERAVILEWRGDIALALEDYFYVFENYPANRTAQVAIERLARRLPSPQQGTGFEFLLASLTGQQRAALRNAMPATSAFFPPIERSSATIHHVIGNLYFKIEERDARFVGGETHNLHVIVNGREQNFIMLRPNRIQLIMDNIGNVTELKNIFTNVIRGVTAREILTSLINAEREAGPRGPRVRD